MFNIIVPLPSTLDLQAVCPAKVCEPIDAPLFNHLSDSKRAEIDKYREDYRVAASIRSHGRLEGQRELVNFMTVYDCAKILGKCLAPIYTSRVLLKTTLSCRGVSHMSAWPWEISEVHHYGSEESIVLVTHLAPRAKWLISLRGSCLPLLGSRSLNHWGIAPSWCESKILVARFPTRSMVATNEYHPKFKRSMVISVCLSIVFLCTCRMLFMVV